MKTIQEEKAKYERVWTHKVYRNTAPGEKLVQEAITHMGMEMEDSVIDFGCGTGRAAQLFWDLNFEVTGVDIAENCLDPSINIPLQIGCLWEPINLRAKFGFCTDVMEHIPPEHVEKTLDNIWTCIEEGVFFQIATRRDGFGPRLIGEPLHLTIKPAEFWLSHFENTKVIKQTPGFITFVAFK